MNPRFDRPIALPFKPLQVITLWQMIHFLADRFITCRERLGFLTNFTDRCNPEDAAKWEELVRFFIRNIRDFAKFADDLQMLETSGRCKHLLKNLEGSIGKAKSLFPKLTKSVLDSEITAIEQTADREIKEIAFVHIPQNKVKYFNQTALFEEKVLAAFPEASAELMNAGNCFAVDLYTASVFHLVRAVEFGMRALALHLKAKTKSPLQYCDWGQLISAIEAKLTALKTKPRGRKKSEEFDFYSRALSDCKAMAESRNRVCHAREPFSKSEAEVVFERAKHLMQNLRTRVSETKT